MKNISLTIISLALSLLFNMTSAQNVSLNILTQNSGLVNIGGTVFLQVDIANTDATTQVPAYKLRPQISVPTSIVSIPASGHNLPNGWTITFNNNAVIRLSNGTDQVPANTTRTILIAIQGNTLGGPLTISGNLLFSNGVAPGSASGVGLPGDNVADNTSTSTVEVTTAVPVKISAFSGTAVNCKPVLNWVTETEINAAAFEIERTNVNSNAWTTLGAVVAKGNSNLKNYYSFTDEYISSDNRSYLYRLKMIDRNGQFSYSYVLPLTVNCKANNITIYPNPVVNNTVYINCSNLNAKADAVIMSATGQALLKINLLNSINTVNVAKLPSGTYILQIASDNLIKREKIIICH